MVDREVRNACALQCVPPGRLHAPNGLGWILRAWKHEIADAVRLLFPPAQDVKRKLTERLRLARSVRLERPFQTNETDVKIDLRPPQLEQFAVRPIAGLLQEQDPNAQVGWSFLKDPHEFLRTNPPLRGAL